MSLADITTEEKAELINALIGHTETLDDMIETWTSHVATLQRGLQIDHLEDLTLPTAKGVLKRTKKAKAITRSIIAKI